jgi:predicted ABC-type exoprotein transport system permease subunit
VAEVLPQACVAADSPAKEVAMKQWLYQVLIRSGLWGLVLWVALFFICLALLGQCVQRSP